MTSEVIASGDANTVSINRYHRIESVRAGTIQVEHASQLHADEYHQPEYLASIEITGRPSHAGFHARSALICFYADTYPVINKPSYDEAKQQIMICYPIHMFESQIEILTRHCEVECTYLEQAELSHGDAFLHGTGDMPEQLH